MTNKSILLALLLTSALAIPAVAQQATVFGNAGGGSGSVTSVATGNGICGGPITTTGTLSACVLQNAQTGITYATLASDGAKIVSLSNASPVAVSLSQANQPGFTAGFGTDYDNIGAGVVTVTATTSVFDNGLTTLAVATGQDAFVWSDGTNYHSLLTLPVMAQDTLLGNPAASNYPVAMAIPSCANDGAHALVYASHALACASISGSGITGTTGNGLYFSGTNTPADGGSAVVSFGGLNVTSSGTTGLSNGMYLSSANVVQIRAASSNKLQISSGGALFATGFVAANAAGPKLADAAASATVPTLMPNQASTTTGIGAQTSGNLSLIVGGAEKARVDANGMAMQAGVFTLKGFTVASLPAAPATGSMAYVTDQTAACSFGGTPVGSGSNVCKVWYNGTAWIDG